MLIHRQRRFRNFWFSWHRWSGTLSLAALAVLVQAVLTPVRNDILALGCSARLSVAGRVALGVVAAVVKGWARDISVIAGFVKGGSFPNHSAARWGTACR